MRVTVKATPAGTISDYDTPDYQPTSFSDDTDAVKEHFGNRPAVKQFDAFLVKVGDGDYDDVLGFYGEMPGVGKPVWRITRTYTADKPKAKKRTTKRTSRAGVSRSLGGVR